LTWESDDTDKTVITATLITATLRSAKNILAAQRRRLAEGIPILPALGAAAPG
jgi:hypothetical protein